MNMKETLVILRVLEIPLIDSGCFLLPQVMGIKANQYWMEGYWRKALISNNAPIWVQKHRSGYGTMGGSKSIIRMILEW